MEDLAYRRLLDVYYLREGPLPADVQVTAKLIRMRSMAEDVESVLNEFFELTEDGWRHERCDLEVAHMQDKQTKARASAAASVKSRQAFAAKKLQTSETNVSNDMNGCSTNVEIKSTDVELPTPTPTPTPIKNTRAQAPAALPSWIPMQAWNGYAEMRKKAKKTMTDRAMELKIAELQKFKDAGYDIASILDKSTANNWTDLYEPKTKPLQPVSGSPSWVIDAGFATIAEANNEGCYQRTAHQFKNGKREVAA